MRPGILSLLAGLLLSSLASAQLSGVVGPTTTRATKRSKKVCNVLDYGGVASKTADIGPPITSAFAACKSGGTGILFLIELGLQLILRSLYPPRRLWNDYLGDSFWRNWMGTAAGWDHIPCGVSFGPLRKMEIKLKLSRTAGGHMIVIEKGSDFEMYSSTSQGAIQGYGYTYHASN